MAKFSDLVSGVMGPQSLLSYQRTYNWDVFFFYSMGGIRGELLSKFCQDIKFGGYSISDIVELRKGGRQEFYPGAMDINIVTMTFVIPSPDIVGKFFQSWRELIVDRQGFYGVKNVYAKNIYVWVEGNNYFPSSRYVLKKAFPLDVPTFDLSYGEEGVLRYSINFKVDRVELAGIVDTVTDFVTGFAKWF